MSGPIAAYDMGGRMGVRSIDYVPCSKSADGPLPLPPPLGSGPGVSRVGIDPFGVLLLIYVPLFFSVLFRCSLGSIFGPFCLPTWLQKSVRMEPKTTKKLITNSIKICMALGTHLGPDLGRF